MSSYSPQERRVETSPVWRSPVAASLTRHHRVPLSYTSNLAQVVSTQPPNEQTALFKPLTLRSPACFFLFFALTLDSLDTRVFQPFLPVQCPHLSTQIRQDTLTERQRGEGERQAQRKPQSTREATHHLQATYPVECKLHISINISTSPKPSPISSDYLTFIATSAPLKPRFERTFDHNIHFFKTDPLNALRYLSQHTLLFPTSFLSSHLPAYYLLQRLIIISQTDTRLTSPLTGLPVSPDWRLGQRVLRQNLIYSVNAHSRFPIVVVCVVLRM